MKIKVKGLRYYRTVNDMRIFETAYTVPWAYNPMINHLDIDAPISHLSGGTSEMKVTRTLQGYDLEIPDWFLFHK